MKNFHKAMMIKELLENNQIIGYHFKKKMANYGIDVSNGSIYYHLKNFLEKGYVTKTEKEKVTIYRLTEIGEKALSKNISSIPAEINHAFMLIAADIPNTNWNNLKDMQTFLDRITHIKKLITKRIGELS